MFRYFITYKPYGMISQFTPDGKKPTLAELQDFPKDVYPIGRLDHDSEGLLILTNDKKLFNRLLHPTYAHKRTYYAQVDGDINDRAIQDLCRGVSIQIESESYFTKKSIAKKIEEPEGIPARYPPVRYRAAIPTSWISLTLTEGKNRQVRKMTATVGFPTLRLIRYSIEDLVLPELIPGKVWEVKGDWLYKQLQISL